MALAKEIGEVKVKEGKEEGFKEARGTGEIGRVASTSSQHQSPLLILNFPQTSVCFSTAENLQIESNCIYPKNYVHFQDGPKNEPKRILID